MRKIDREPFPGEKEVKREMLLREELGNAARIRQDLIEMLIRLGV